MSVSLTSRLGAVGAAVLAAGALLTPSAAAIAPTAAPTRVVAPGCAAPTPPGRAHCDSLFRAPEASGRAGRPEGYGPAEFRAAYQLPSTGAKTTVAVVVAYDVPNAAADLAVYRRTMGLPACTPATGCFRKVNQRGLAGPLPAADPGWAMEGSMDIQMVSATCPTCRILLVEADDAFDTSLAAATRSALRLGATVLSHSYGGPEYGGMWRYQDAYEKPGTISVASTGDSGFIQAQTPAVFRRVLAVGGTTLRRAAGTTRRWDEDVWEGSGSGCSAYIPKPSYQRDGLCRMRMIADVAAVADPDTGVAVYDSYPNPYGLPPGWLVGGGTSASAPLVAGMIGLAGNGATYTPSMAYAARSSFWDVVGGSNGDCDHDYTCTGLSGYDGPSGLGTPRGLRGL